MKKIDYYNENGYVVYKNLISKTLINDFLKTYKKDFLSAKGNYPQMNTQKWGDINISSHGYLQDPIGDIHLINFINQDFGQFVIVFGSPWDGVFWIK